MGRWTFLRHGESEANAARRLAGWEDVPLTPRGREQAALAGRVLREERFDRVLTSDLWRARESARIALEAWAEATGRAPPPIEQEPALRERHLGAFRGRCVEDLRRSGRIEVLLGWRGRPPGGESHADLAARALPRLAEIDGGEDVLVIGHGGMLRVLLGLLDGVPLEEIGRWRIPNAEATAREVAPGRWAELALAYGRAGAAPPPGIVLASGSPRRLALLLAAGVPVVAVRTPAIDEARLPGEPAVAFARRLAAEKAAAVGEPGEVVLAADTVVHLGDEVFDKPRDEEDAARILASLQGRWHQVTTAWCLRSGRDEGARVAHRTSRVRFRPLSPPEIRAYVASGEGRDKAGAYGVQGLGAALVERVSGSYSNVVGLPVGEVVLALSRLGIRPR